MHALAFAYMRTRARAHTNMPCAHMYTRATALRMVRLFVFVCAYSWQAKRWEVRSALSRIEKVVDRERWGSMDPTEVDGSYARQVVGPWLPISLPNTTQLWLAL